MLILFCVVGGVGLDRLQAQNVTEVPMMQTVPSTYNSLFGRGTLGAPLAVTVDRAGNLYIADTENAVVRRVDALTGNMSTVAGGSPSGCPGQTDSFGDGCPANDAAIYPEGLALDQAGNLYVADGFRSLVRRVDAASGIISIFAGGGTGCSGQTDSFGDGCPATSAQLSRWSDGILAGIVVDGAGNVYIADSNNGLVRKVSSQTGIITIAAGIGLQSEAYCQGETDIAGDGCPATRASVLGIQAGWHWTVPATSTSPRPAGFGRWTPAGSSIPSRVLITTLSSTVETAVQPPAPDSALSVAWLWTASEICTSPTDMTM